MTIASEITKLNTNLTNAYTAVDGKGGTLPQAQNFDNLATAISSIPSSGTPTLITKSITQNGTYLASTDNVDGYSEVTVNVSGGGSGKYQLLQRIIDDNGNQIGTVSGFFIDGNDVEYAVVCLDATYRNSSAQWASATGNVTNMPLYSNWTIWEAPETATENTTLILASKTSSACTHCRSKSFTIGGVTYYGQLPNIIELVDIARHRTAINAADTSGGSITIATNNSYWSSSQYSSTYGWCIGSYGNGAALGTSKTGNYYVCPVLEIPNQ